MSALFLVAFEDKEVTRMTVWNGEVGRAIRLARIAYESRKRRPPPNIIAMRFIEEDCRQMTFTGRDLGFIMMMADELKDEPWFQKTTARLDTRGNSPMNP
jgi:hypothetical protein